MDEYVYNGIIKNISTRFESELENMSTVYNFDLGAEFEIAVCKVLRKILPLKYGICRGFVVDKSDNKGGDDIIIYDRMNFPNLRFLGHEDDYARKNQIPVEAVYAYIEAKHKLDADTLDKAFDQIVKVKKICYNRHHIALVPVENGVSVFNNEYSKKNGWNPIVTTPVYTMIISKECVDLTGVIATNGDDSTKFLQHQISDTLAEKIASNSMYNPDAIIAGDASTAICAHHLYDKDGKGRSGLQITRFYTGIEPFACYQIAKNDNIAYGLGVSHLMLALDFIKLKTMPWDMIFNVANVEDKAVRDGLIAELAKNSE